MNKIIFLIIIVIVGGLGLWQFLTVDSIGKMTEVNNFEECVHAGNPVMESYPRQCRHGDTNYVEEIEEDKNHDVDENSDINESEGGIENNEGSVVDGNTDTEKNVIVCSDEAKKATICPAIYAPVCGLVQIQCVTTPCNPIPETFASGCNACAQGNVISYTEGECSI